MGTTSVCPGVIGLIDMNANAAIIAMHEGPGNIAVHDHGEDGAHTPRQQYAAPYD